MEDWEKLSVHDGRAAGLLGLQPPKKEGKASLRAAVIRRFTKAMGSRNFQPRSKS
jgi:hypothetical protein